MKINYTYFKNVIQKLSVTLYLLFCLIYVKKEVGLPSISVNQNYLVVFGCITWCRESGKRPETEYRQMT